MSTEDNKAVSNRIAAAIAAHDFDTIDALVAPEFAAGLKQALEEIYQAFPDFAGVNEIQVAEGDYVANHAKATGTHRGEWMGIPPTGRQVVFETITIDEIRDGRLVNAAIVNNTEHLVEQLGARLRAEVVEDASPGG